MDALNSLALQNRLQLCTIPATLKWHGVLLVQEVRETLTKTRCSTAKIYKHTRKESALGTGEKCYLLFCFGWRAPTRITFSDIIYHAVLRKQLCGLNPYVWHCMFLCHGAVQRCGHACSAALRCPLILRAMAWHTVHRERHLCALSRAPCPYVAGTHSNVAIIQTRTSGPLFVGLCSISGGIIPEKRKKITSWLKVDRTFHTGCRRSLQWSLQSFREQP